MRWTIKASLIAGFLVVALVGVVIGVAFYLAPAPQQSSQTKKTKSPSESATWEEVIPGQGKGTPPSFAQPGEDGPWNHRVEIASSSDGFTFTKDGVILSGQASVPDAILDKAGKIRVYYVDWENRGLTVAIQQNGNKYKFYRVKVRDLKSEENGVQLVDPDVVLLPDGRYRLYGVSSKPQGQPGDPGRSNGTNQILSAISSDGVLFELENGVRHQANMATDPDVVKTAEGWQMFFSLGPDLVSLMSKDGLTFGTQLDVRIGGSVGTTLPVDGQFRLYYHVGMESGLNIHSAISTDLVTWQKEPGVRLEGGGDPAPVKLPDGTYKMFYKTLIEPMTQRQPPLPPPR